MVNPYRSINNYHYDILLLSISFSFLSVPPSFDNRLLLSRAISASNPIFTRYVFSFIPVSFEALLYNSSLILIVVLIFYTSSFYDDKYAYLCAYNQFNYNYKKYL